MVIMLLSSGGAHFPNIECEAGKVTPYSYIVITNTVTVKYFSSYIANSPLLIVEVL